MKKFTKFLSLIMSIIMIFGTCSALMISASAASAPEFSIEETSKNGNVVTYEFKLDKGSFNAIDFTFTTVGATCTSIVLADNFVGGVSNAKSASVSYANVQGFSTKGTVATATFTVNSDSYSVGVKVTNCNITVGTENEDVTRQVKVTDNSNLSFFARLIRFFLSIIDFIVGLFS